MVFEDKLSSEKEPEEKKRILQNDFGIRMTKKLEREVSQMCNLSQGIEERGIEKGRKEGRKEGKQEGILASIQNLMESMGWTAEQAMAALKIPESERLSYADGLKRLLS